MIRDNLHNDILFLFVNYTKKSIHKFNNDNSSFSSDSSDEEQEQKEVQEEEETVVEDQGNCFFGPNAVDGGS
jgi:hypothetical protein